MSVNIEANLKAYRKLWGAHGSPEVRSADGRDASFDYCFNHFQDARDHHALSSLDHGEGLALSCLHLGFYLASWGMMRGPLRDSSVRGLMPVVQAVVSEGPAVWALDVDSYETHAGEVVALGERIRKAFIVNASPTLVTKTMLGVFGCVPALDEYFCLGFRCSQTLTTARLHKIWGFYQENKAAIDAAEDRTLDLATGIGTNRRYPTARIIDMVLFQEGISRAKPTSK